MYTNQTFGGNYRVKFSACAIFLGVNIFEHARREDLTVELSRLTNCKGLYTNRTIKYKTEITNPCFAA